MSVSPASMDSRHFRNVTTTSADPIVDWPDPVYDSVFEYGNLFDCIPFVYEMQKNPKGIVVKRIEFWLENYKPEFPECGMGFAHDYFTLILERLDRETGELKINSEIFDKLKGVPAYKS